MGVPSHLVLTLGLLQEETQGQGEEEEREAEAHRLPPVSARGPRDGKEAGPEGSPALPPGLGWGAGEAGLRPVLGAGQGASPPQDSRAQEASVDLGFLSRLSPRFPWTLDKSFHLCEPSFSLCRMRGRRSSKHLVTLQTFTEHFLCVRYICEQTNRIPALGKLEFPF